jgi:hypothetical protein
LCNGAVSLIDFTLLRLLTGKSLVKLGSWVVRKIDGVHAGVRYKILSFLALDVIKARWEG